jgi:hypothetical protein
MVVYRVKDYLSGVAAFISGFLTIIASELYSPQPIQTPYRVQMLQTDTFNLSYIVLSQDDKLAGTTTKLTVLNNLSYPTCTYDNLVFSSSTAQFPRSFCGSNTTIEGSSISMKVPALRPSLECITAPPNIVSQLGNFYYEAKLSTLYGGTSTTINAMSGIYNYTSANFSWSFAPVNTTFAKQLGSAQWPELFIIPSKTEKNMPNTPIEFAFPVQWFPEEDSGSILKTAMDQTIRVGLDIDPSFPIFLISAGMASGSKND